MTDVELRTLFGQVLERLDAIEQAIAAQRHVTGEPDALVTLIRRTVRGAHFTTADLMARAGLDEAFGAQLARLRASTPAAMGRRLSGILRHQGPSPSLRLDRLDRAADGVLWSIVDVASAAKRPLATFDGIDRLPPAARMR